MDEFSDRASSEEKYFYRAAATPIAPPRPPLLIPEYHLLKLFIESGPPRLIAIPPARLLGPSKKLEID